VPEKAEKSHTDEDHCERPLPTTVTGLFAGHSHAPVAVEDRYRSMAHAVESDRHDRLRGLHESLNRVMDT
jgi:hypothetical protein